MNGYEAHMLATLVAMRAEVLARASGWDAAHARHTAYHSIHEQHSPYRCPCDACTARRLRTGAGWNRSA